MSWFVAAVLALILVVVSRGNPRMTFWVDTFLVWSVVLSLCFWAFGEGLSRAGRRLANWGKRQQRKERRRRV